MNTYNVGDRVRVLPPFADSFPGEHVITEVVVHDGAAVYVLGENGGFDEMYLETA